MLQIEIDTIQKLPQAAQQFIQLMKKKPEINCFAFYGEMGVGKTTFIKTLCSQLGIAENVSSPTFALINEYQLNNDKNLYHFDFYRINEIDEVYDFGYEDYFFGNDICLIEWPEKIEELLPENHLKIIITEDENKKRTLKINE